MVPKGPKLYFLIGHSYNVLAYIFKPEVTNYEARENMKIQVQDIGMGKWQLLKIYHTTLE